jgi:hypothetical protein
MMKNDYNGWTNKQTWNISLLFNGIFHNIAEEQKFDDVNHLADAFESLVNEVEFEELREGTLAHQAVGEYLDQVNWNELAEHIAADHDLFLETEDSEEDIKGLRELIAEAELE